MKTATLPPTLSRRVWFGGLLISVPRIHRFTAIRPILDLVREVRPWLVREIRRHVHRLLIRQAALPQRELFMEPDRHVAFDERRSGVGTRHPGTDVERLVTPQRRKNKTAVRVFQTLPAVTVAHRALLDVHRFAVAHVRLDARIVATARSLPPSGNKAVHYVAADLSTAEGARHAAAAALRHLGGIDVLINVAGGSSAPAGGFAVLDDVEIGKYHDYPDTYK